ncbi:MAG: hypothetical protein WDZ29_03300 [Balneolaceae bacterium]
MAPQVSKITHHPKREEIEQDIIKGLPHTKISKKYDVPYFAVRYWAENKLPEKLVDAERRSEIQHTDGILQRVTRMLNESERILGEATERGWHGTQLKAIREHNSSIELLAKLYVKMDEVRQREQQAEKAEDRQEGIMQAIEYLSLDEIKCLNYLQCKATAYLDEQASNTMRNYFQEYGEDPEGWPELKYVLGEKTEKSRSVFDVETAHQVQNSSKEPGLADQPNKPRLRIKRKATQPAESDDLDFEDLELDDLDDLDDLSVPAKDPDWLEESRSNQWKGAYRPE